MQLERCAVSLSDFTQYFSRVRSNRPLTDRGHRARAVTEHVFPGVVGGEARRSKRADGGHTEGLPSLLVKGVSFFGTFECPHICVFELLGWYFGVRRLAGNCPTTKKSRV